MEKERAGGVFAGKDLADSACISAISVTFLNLTTAQTRGKRVLQWFQVRDCLTGDAGLYDSVLVGAVGCHFAPGNGYNGHAERRESGPL